MKKSTVLFLISFILLILALLLAVRYTRAGGLGEPTQRTSRTTNISSPSPGKM